MTVAFRWYLNFFHIVGDWNLLKYVIHIQEKYPLNEIKIQIGNSPIYHLNEKSGIKSFGLFNYANAFLRQTILLLQSFSYIFFC